MWEYVSYDELYHYGVKGMRWGVRKKQIRQDENDRRVALFKKHKVYDALEEADIAYAKDGYSKRVNTLMDKANTLEQKAYSELKSEMKAKYGKDYDRYKKGERAAALMTGAAVGTAAIGVPVLGVVAVGKLASGTVKLGAKAVSKIFKK